MSTITRIQFNSDDAALSEKLAKCEVEELETTIGTTSKIEAFASLILSKEHVKHAREKFDWFVRAGCVDVDEFIGGWPLILACSPQFRRFFIEHGSAKWWPNITSKGLTITNKAGQQDEVIAFTRADAPPTLNTVVIRLDDWRYATTGRADEAASQCVVS